MNHTSVWRRLCRPALTVLTTVGLVAVGLGVGTASAPGVAPAVAAVPASSPTTSVVAVRTGSDRTGTSGVTPLAGVQLGLFTLATFTSPVNNTWAVCTSDAAGDCSFSVPNTQTGGVNVNARFYVKQISAPAGWYANGVVKTQVAATQSPVSTAYAFQTPALVAGTTYRSGTGATSGSGGFMSDPTNRNSLAVASGGVWQQSRVNPDLAGCGLSVALVLDVSGSVGTNLPNLQGAGRSLVNALVGTPSDVGLFTFSSNAPADAAGNQNRPRTAVSTQAGADTVNAWIDGTTSGGGTNWDRGLAQVAEDTHHYDVAMMITDGSPTFYGLPPNLTWFPNNPEYAQGPGSATRARELENGVFSANALKAKGTRVVAVGVGGGITSSIENLVAISGPTAGSDYYATSDYAGAGAALRAQALSKCQGSVSVVSQLIAEGASAADATPQPGWTFSATVPSPASVSPATGITDQTGGTTFTVTPASGSTTTPLTITDQVAADTTVVPQNGANAACRDLATGASVPVTDQGATGFQVDAPATAPIGCTVLHQASSAPVITGGAVTGRVGEAVAFTPTVTGGASPFTWTVQEGHLPDGLALDTSTGSITGTPTAAGTGSITLRAVDALGRAATGTVTFTVTTPTVTTLPVPASSRFGQPVALAAAVTPTGTGSVRFGAVATSGPSAGTTVAIGTAPVGPDGTAGLSWTPTALGSFAVSATYLGDDLHETSSSPASPIAVLARPGSLIVSEFRQSGPGGAADGYVVLTNTGSTAIPLVGYRVVTGSGVTVPFTAASGDIQPGRSHLVAAAAYSLTAVAPADTTVPSLGSGGVTVVAPDPEATTTDAVGPVAGPHNGTALPTLSGAPTQQYAWVRLRTGNVVLQNTRDNAADFALVSAAGGPVGGLPSMVGAPAPMSATGPAPTREAPSALLSGGDAAASPNRIVTRTQSGVTTLTVNRMVVNQSTAPITTMRIRLTSISEANGIRRPGVTRPASLVVASPSTPTSTFDVGGRTVTVQNLTPTQPVLSTGGLNTTYSVPLPNGRLDPGQSVPVSFTFTVQSVGTFWLSYATEVH